LSTMYAVPSFTSYSTVAIDCDSTATYVFYTWPGDSQVHACSSGTACTTSSKWSSKTIKTGSYFGFNVFGFYTSGTTNYIWTFVSSSTSSVLASLTSSLTSLTTYTLSFKASTVVGGVNSGTAYFFAISSSGTV
jgi:hypothetical protein